MGSPENESCREFRGIPYFSIPETQHNVWISRDFEIQQTEVTQAQFKAMLDYNPSKSIGCGPNCPVEFVSWDEAAAYCNSLSILAGVENCYYCTGGKEFSRCDEYTRYRGNEIYACQGYRLPTEAEWEYSYRAGTLAAFYNGKITVPYHDIDPNAIQIAWYKYNSGDRIHPVGEKLPNSWGLFDMSGNVEEYCNDSWQKDLGNADVTNPATIGNKNYPVVRGGSFNHEACYLRAAARHPPYTSPKGKYAFNNIGFRCVRTLKP